MRKLTTIICIVIIVASACTPVYIPNSRSVPLFEKPGQVTLDGYVSGRGFDVNAGGSLTDHFAIIGNFSYGKSEGEEEDDYHEHRFGEIGLGYYNHGSSTLQTEFFAGYGLGEGTSVDEYLFISQNIERTTGYYNRAFMQANLGWAPGAIKLGGVLRFSYVNFTEFETTSSSIKRSKNATFAEPAFFFKAGDKIHFNFQAGFNVPMHDNVAFDYRFLHLSMGIGAKLNL